MEDCGKKIKGFGTPDSLKAKFGVLLGERNVDSYEMAAAAPTADKAPSDTVRSDAEALLMSPEELYRQGDFKTARDRLVEIQSA